MAYGFLDAQSQELWGWETLRQWIHVGCRRGHATSSASPIGGRELRTQPACDGEGRCDPSLAGEGLRLDGEPGYRDES